MKSFPALYGTSKTDKTKKWLISVKMNPDKTATIITENGYLDGKMNVSHRIIKTGKNIGKANETTVLEQAVQEAEKKYNDKIEKEGYSTDPDHIEIKVFPMLANKFDPKKKKSSIIFPCFVQPKLDGLRCMTSNKKAPVMKSRAGLEFKRIPHLIEEAKKFFEVADGLGHGSIYIDGELYTDKIPFEELSGCIRMEDETDPEKEAKLKLIEYHIYDLYCADNPEMDYEDRKKLIDSIFKKKKFTHLKNVETDDCKNKEDVEDFHSSFIEKGYEGCMLRNKLGAYLLRYRSNDLLKYKKFEDGEFEVCGYEEANGEDAGTIIWECYYVNSEGKKEKFKVRPKGSREFRRELFENAKKSFKKMYLGKLLTVRFQEISKDGCPRFPVGIGIRHDI